MAETTPVEEAIDLTKYSAGAVDLETFAGEPVDTLKHIMFNRAGVPMTHSLQSNLVNTRPGDQARCARIPVPFAPTEADYPLISVQDWLDYIGRVQVLPTPIVHDEIVIENSVFSESA